jgi:hypothetical protein
VIAGTLRKTQTLLPRSEPEQQEMPLFFYFPLIVWMGMYSVAQDELRAPVKIKAKR